MPRGPGKKENYNLNYDRFSGIDLDEDAAADAGGATGASPELRQALGQTPPELQEAFRLMSISKATGDVEAQKRANDLALRAVEKGGPEIRQRFMSEVSRMDPQAAAMLADPGGQGEPRRAQCDGPMSETATKSNLAELQRTMRKGQDDVRKQLDSLEKQKEQLESISSPEDFFKFMKDGGMSEEDLQRAFSGDEEHMKAAIERMIDQAAVPDVGARASAEKALQAASQITETLRGEAETLRGEASDPPEGSRGNLAAQDGALSLPKAEESPKVAIPEHRLQYRKGADGRYEAVELRVELPGVSDMGSVSLDVSERHMRLVTSSPVPLFAVNVGPFPVLVDAASAKAKFSKKRQELVVTVPALARPG